MEKTFFELRMLVAGTASELRRLRRLDPVRATELEDTIAGFTAQIVRIAESASPESGEARSFVDGQVARRKARRLAILKAEYGRAAAHASAFARLWVESGGDTDALAGPTAESVSAALPAARAVLLRRE